MVKFAPNLLRLQAFTSELFAYMAWHLERKEVHFQIGKSAHRPASMPFLLLPEFVASSVKCCSRRYHLHRCASEYVLQALEWRTFFGFWAPMILPLSPRSIVILFPPGLLNSLVPHTWAPGPLGLGWLN